MLCTVVEGFNPHGTYLDTHLPHTVNELQEDGSSLVIIMCTATMACTL